jgi:hypothetical protein
MIEICTGLTWGNFQTRFNKHMSDLRINETATTLSIEQADLGLEETKCPI